MTILQTITLYYREGASDKVYQTQINETPEGCTVTFVYGRRGSAMKDGSKTASPVPYEKAKKIYDQLVAGKMAKGYTLGKDGTPFTGSSAKERSDMPVQLLNAVDESQVRLLCLEPIFAAQEKIDGERRLLERRDGTLRGINRKGLYVAVTELIAQAAEKIAEAVFVIDGEQIGDTLHAFDLLENESGDLLHLPYRERYELLASLIEDSGNQNAIVLVPLAESTAHKLALVETVKSKGGEGVVFKNLRAGYTGGRPSSGGDALKFKFYETCSVVVSEINDSKRSVGLSVYDGDTTVSVGNVTIPPNHKIPAVGDVVEVKYLYAFKGGSLYQPIFLGKRSDLDVNECVIAQIKYKQDAAA